MKTNKNVKGFTLVELIVVIAIIGVLAAILVPSMLGYVKKSKVSAANSNAKSLYDAANTACVELDTQGTPVEDGDLDAKAGDEAFVGQVKEYFNGVTELGTATVRVENHMAVAALCTDKGGTYTGTYPHPTTVDNYPDASLDYAQNGDGE
ncbi:MAG TPA: hypothetical protein DCO72_00430 [Ruminococcus sp.]|nr:hypothetical protein [Ruminococcus sp.]